MIDLSKISDCRELFAHARYGTDGTPRHEYDNRLTSRNRQILPIFHEHPCHTPDDKSCPVTTSPQGKGSLYEEDDSDILAFNQNNSTRLL